MNDMIAILLEDGESASDIDGFINDNDAQKAKPETKAEIKTEEKKPMQNMQTHQTTSTPASGSRIFASPLARRIAANKNIDLSTIQGSGPRGRIVKADVESAKSGAALQSTTTTSVAPQPTGDQQVNEFGMIYTEIPNNNIKKITAQRLQESKSTVPHFYLTIECWIDELTTHTQTHE